MKIDMPDDVPDEVADQVGKLLLEYEDSPEAQLGHAFGDKTRHYSGDIRVEWDEDYNIVELDVTYLEKETGIISRRVLVNGRLVDVMAGTA
jgi:hypothetical protein